MSQGLTAEAALDARIATTAARIVTTAARIAALKAEIAALEEATAVGIEIGLAALVGIEIGLAALVGIGIAIAVEITGANTSVPSPPNNPSFLELVCIAEAI
jgi:uncharacterized oligopeptide transporter (OPT) family protein